MLGAPPTHCSTSSPLPKSAPLTPCTSSGPPPPPPPPPPPLPPSDGRSSAALSTVYVAPAQPMRIPASLRAPETDRRWSALVRVRVRVNPNPNPNPNPNRRPIAGGAPPIR
eukprot:scaffold10448_cov68-Phaeocystis_antarctica.AAC.7